MRNIRRKLKMKTVKITAYDTETKQEKILNMEIAEVEEAVKLPENLVLISEEVVLEKEVIFRMTPETFVKNAEIIEE